jgi:Threonine synthase N terminus
MQHQSTQTPARRRKRRPPQHTITTKNLLPTTKIQSDNHSRTSIQYGQHKHPKPKVHLQQSKLQERIDQQKENKMPSVTYSSTRGGQTNLDFRTVVMTGLARDRGLFVPDEIPKVTVEEVESWRELPFADVAINVISKFVEDDQVPREKLDDIVRRSCAAFRHEDVTPVVDVAGHQVLVRPS